MKTAKGQGKTKAGTKSKAKTEGKTKSGGKSSKTTRRTARENSPDANKRVDIVQVRENVRNLVAASAEIIAAEVIETAKAGQLAAAKYLFEMIGLYPATEEPTEKPQEDSLARVLLRRMGLPTEPGTGVSSGKDTVE